MLQFSEIRGAIFDVDDTLLNNHPDGSRLGLHERSRLAAAHMVGERYGNVKLQAFTEQQSIDAFRQAKAHTLQAAVWRMLWMAGEVTVEDIEPAHPLLNEIMELKDELHEQILRTEGCEVPGATRFVQQLHAHLPAGKLAIASTASRRDIDIFLEMTGMDQYFPDKHIISRERFTHPKPHPEAYNKAFATLGLPEEARRYVATFEDDPRGFMSADGAGLFTGVITTRYSRQELTELKVVPDLVADSYAEFETALGFPAAA